MVEISQASKDHIYELVSSQKKAKLDWVSSMTEIPVERIIAVAVELGLIIDGDFISLPLKHEEIPIDSMETKYSRAIPKDVTKTEKTRQILLLILAIFMILITIPALLFGSIYVFFACGKLWAIFTGILMIIGGITSCIFGFRIFMKVRYTI